MLLIVILSLLRVLSCVWCEESKIIVTGYEGRTVTITCPSGGYRDHEKYLWKGDYYNGVYAIWSDGYAEWTRSGRFSLQDKKDRNVFIVTIHNLTLEDAGIYGCGITLVGYDYYTVVMLKLEIITRDTMSANSMSGHVGYIGVVLTVLVSVLVIILAILYKKKTRGNRMLSAPPAGPQPNTNSDNTGKQMTDVQCHYAEVTIHAGNSASTSSCATPSTDPSDIYSNVLQPSNQNPDSVEYSSIRFDRDEETLQ